MKKSKLFLVMALAFTMSSTLGFDEGLCMSIEAPYADYILKKANEVGPEEMIKFGFKTTLYKKNYTNPYDIDRKSVV